MNKWIAPLLVLLLVGTACSVFEETNVCAVCGRPIRGKLLYRISFRNGSQIDTCCPRCGLRYQNGRTDVAHVEVTDFNSGRLIDASRAYYVESSKVMLCCSDNKLQRDRSGGQYVLEWDRCMPSLVSFETLSEAESFSQRMGGVIKDYETLRREPEFSEKSAGRAGPDLGGRGPLDRPGS